jgi:hypothetical protein
VICTLNLDGKLQLISDRVDLYATAARLLYHDRDKKKNISDPLYRALTREQKERILSYIAYQFIKNGMNSATMADIVSMIMRSRNEEESENAEREASSLAEALLLRSGVLNEVSPDNIQFLHKTFQEYLGALEVIYRQDERHVARNFDLKSWGELYLIILSIAPREVGTEMVEIVFERASGREKDWLAYLLLAGAGCREVHEIAGALKEAVSAGVSELIPPQDIGMVYQLAEMGGLVLPFLTWREEYGQEETGRILTLLGLIEEEDAGPMMEDYAARGLISPDTIECFVRGLDYKNESNLTREVITRLKARKSMYFWKESPRSRLYVGSRGLLRYSDSLPQVGWLVLDGRDKLGVNEALATDWRATDRITRLSMVSAGNFQASKLERFKSLREIDFAESFVDEAEFLSFLRRLKIMRLVDSELADWRTLQYGELSRLYIAGTSVVEAVYHEIEVIMGGASKVFLDLDCIRGIEGLEGTRFEHFDTWGIQVWAENEVSALKEELGMR